MWFLIPRSDAEIAGNLGSLVDSAETYRNVAIFRVFRRVASGKVSWFSLT
jgi:hypothetical protein